MVGRSFHLDEAKKMEFSMRILFDNITHYILSPIENYVSHRHDIGLNLQALQFVNFVVRVGARLKRKKRYKFNLQKLTFKMIPIT